MIIGEIDWYLSSASSQASFLLEARLGLVVALMGQQWEDEKNDCESPDELRRPSHPETWDSGETELIVRQSSADNWHSRGRVVFVDQEENSRTEYLLVRVGT